MPTNEPTKYDVVEVEPTAEPTWTDSLSYEDENAVTWLVCLAAPIALRVLGHPLAADQLDSVPRAEKGRRAPSVATKVMKEVREDLESSGRSDELFQYVSTLTESDNPNSWRFEVMPGLSTLANHALDARIWPKATGEAYWLFSAALEHLAMEFGTDSEQWEDAIDDFATQARTEAREPWTMSLTKEDGEWIYHGVRNAELAPSEYDTTDPESK